MRKSAHPGWWSWMEEEGSAYVLQMPAHRRILMGSAVFVRVNTAQLCSLRMGDPWKYSVYGMPKNSFEGNRAQGTLEPPRLSPSSSPFLPFLFHFHFHFITLKHVLSTVIFSPHVCSCRESILHKIMILEILREETLPQQLPLLLFWKKAFILQFKIKTEIQVVGEDWHRCSLENALLLKYI